jgi:LPXTG-motif cell wall-anchored protein
VEKPKWAEEEQTPSLFAVRNTSDAAWIGLMALGVLGALALWVLDRKRNS